MKRNGMEIISAALLASMQFRNIITFLKNGGMKVSARWLAMKVGGLGVKESGEYVDGCHVSSAGIELQESSKVKKMTSPKSRKTLPKKCSLCQWGSPRFDKNELWCDANSVVVRPDWQCSSFTRKQTKKVHRETDA